MTVHTTTPPVLSPMQRAWLQEIGIDGRMLAHFSQAPFAAAPVEKAPVDAEVAPSASVESSSVRPVNRPQGEGAAAIASLLKRTPLPVEPTPEKLTPARLPEVDTWVALRDYAAECVSCGLHEVRGRTVFGEGAEAPQWMFIGEAPGEYDESVGQPFQGRAGELLQAMLASIGADRNTSMYFTNVLKCRPMGNRSPDPAEVAACLPLLRRQIALVQPACLVALGRVAAGALLGVDDDLETLRGSVHDYIGEDNRRIPVVVTHHPASLLLHAQYKADAWRDLNLLRDLKLEGR